MPGLSITVSPEAALSIAFCMLANGPPTLPSPFSSLPFVATHQTGPVCDGERSMLAGELS